MALWSRLQSLISGRQRQAAQLRPEQAVAPRNVDVGAAANHEARAHQALSDNDVQQAIVCLLDALELTPERASLHCLLAEAYVRSGELDEARDSYTLAIHHSPGCLDAYLGLGSLLAQHGNHAEALRIYTAGIERLPDAAELHTNRALQLFEMNRPEHALSSCETALRLNPQMSEAWHNLGFIKLHLDDPDGALHAFDRALSIRPGVLATMACRGHALRDSGRVEAAVAAYESVLAKDPAFDDAIRNLGYTHLLQGDFTAGWRNYEWRFGKPGRPIRGFPFAAWRGEPLAGKAILVIAEQGIGDEIMFASCLPDLIRAGARCVIECNTRLGTLFQRSFPQAHIHAEEKIAGHEWLQGIGEIDYQAPIGDLPRYLRSCTKDFASPEAYLVPDPVRVQRWQGVLARHASGLPVVGIAWRGGTLKSRGRSRSIALERLRGLLSSTSVKWVSLQRGTLTASETALLQNLGVLQPAFDGGEEIEQLAALLAALDHVVSIDSTVVHVAGALGRPLSVLLPLCPEWRYGIEGGTMLWYPEVQLFRQRAVGAWEVPVAELNAALKVRFPAAPR